ncbi:protein PML-like isoform X2 [Tiliqua scincoides]|uniref:protein PML-like isoform X2 n=1 Tax=Tiliqua scincoides TaxID=71010 RepID=UPI003462668E
MYCSSHKDQPLSLYCKGCRKSMCCTCAEEDSKHAGQRCIIQQEIQRRKDELRSMSTELTTKKSIYLDTCMSLQELVKDKARVKNETRELIQQTLSVLIQEKEKQLLGALEEQHNQEVQVLTEKIQHIQEMVERMESAERLVEMMPLSASDQDMMDMHLCIRGSLENIKKDQIPVVDSQMQTESFTDVITQLQMLIEGVTGEKETASAILERASNKDCSGKSPTKRKNVPEEKAVQIPPKVFRTRPVDGEQRTSSRQVSSSLLEDQPGTSSASVGGSQAAENDGEVSDASSWFPSFISESTDPDDPSCLNSCPEEDSSDEVSAGDEDATLQERSQREATMCPISTPMVLNQGQGTLVFFNLKTLRCELLGSIQLATVENRRRD